VAEPVSCFEIALGIQERNQRQGDHYYSDYRQKFVKIEALVSLLSAKTTKLKYQFMVHLERWSKQQAKKEENISKPQS
jgi:hypothetical protein